MVEFSTFHSLYLLTLFVDLFGFIHFLYQTKKITIIILVLFIIFFFLLLSTSD